MAYSYKEYVGDGSTDTFAIPFDYIASADISVFIDGVADTGFTFTTPSSVQTSSVPGAGAVIRVARSTDITSRAVDFASGSILTEEDLDNSNIQVFYAAQEATDTAEEGLFKTADGKFDAQSRVIKNAADPVNAQDVVTKNWAETAMSSQLSAATTQASAAAASATAAAASEVAAGTSASSASGDAATATTKAAEAATSATNSATSATASANSATAAANSASTATTKAGEAATSATSAATSSSNATAQATAAAGSASTASTAAATATAKATDASTAASNAASSASTASSAATSATSSANAANTSATNAASSATSAGTSATSALSSKNAAATSETNAANSATAAATSATAAQAALDSIENFYLGAEASAPTVDDNGNPLAAGDWYFNTTDNKTYVYNGSSWQITVEDTSGLVAKTSSTGSAVLPAGTTAQRDGSPSAGYLRWNSDDTSAEVYDGSAWTAVGGGNSTTEGLYEHSHTISANYSITSGNNAMSAGPMTVNTGVSVTVPSGSTWTIV